MNIPFLNPNRWEPGQGFIPGELPRDERMHSFKLHVHPTSAGQAELESNACSNCAGARGCQTPNLLQAATGGCVFGTSIGEGNQHLSRCDFTLIAEIEDALDNGVRPRRILKNDRYRETLYHLRKAFDVYRLTNRACDCFDPACVALCKKGCNHNWVHDPKSGRPGPVGTQGIEGLVSRIARKLGWFVMRVQPWNGVTVAVVGTGYAAMPLTILAELGCRVVFYDKNPEPVGTAALIPPWHNDISLPRNHWKMYRSHPNIRVEFNAEVGDNGKYDIEWLEAHHDLIFWAPGAQNPVTHPAVRAAMEEHNLTEIPGCYQAIDFIRNIASFDSLLREPNLRLYGSGGGFSIIDWLGTVARYVTQQDITSWEAVTTLVRKPVPNGPRYETPLFPDNYLWGIVDYDEVLQEPRFETSLTKLELDDRGRVRGGLIKDAEGERFEAFHAFVQGLGWTGISPELIQHFANAGRELKLREGYTLPKLPVLGMQTGDPKHARHIFTGDAMTGSRDLVTAGGTGAMAATLGAALLGLDASEMLPNPWSLLLPGPMARPKLYKLPWIKMPRFFAGPPTLTRYP